MQEWHKNLSSNPAWQALEGLPHRMYCVGGIVRDALLGASAPCEIDLTTTDDLNAIVASLSTHPFVVGVKEYPRFGTASVAVDAGAIRRIDIVRARKEVYRAPGDLPETTPGALEDDLRRRDFTINALAVPLGEFTSPNWYAHLIDRVNARADIGARRIRFLHQNSFIDDPTRIFRAVRYLVRLDCTFEGATERGLLRALRDEALNSISTERIIHELKLVCAEPSGARMIVKLSKYGIFESLGIPELDLLAESYADTRDLDLFLWLRATWLFLTPAAQRTVMAPKLGLAQIWVRKLDEYNSALPLHLFKTSARTFA